MEYEQLITPALLRAKPSGIRRFFDLAADIQGVVSLGVGEPDFPTPMAAREAAVRMLNAGSIPYTANAGTKQLRTAISAYLERRFSLSYDPMREIIVTVGGSEGIDLSLRSLLQEGDEVIGPSPCFVCYAPLARMTGAKVVEVATRAENSFALTADQLRSAITPKTKLLILSYPNNPTGAILGREQLEELAKVLRRSTVMVLSDEIYAELTYDGQHTSIASLPGMRERTILVSGFSKAFAMTGWRLGYLCAPRPAAEQLLKLHQYALMCAPALSQEAALAALAQADTEVERMREQYDNRRRFLTGELRRIGMTCFEPKGAFYVFPSIRSTGLSSVKFCEELLCGQRVAVVPGDAFGPGGEGFVRISYAYSQEHLTEAIRRMEVFLENPSKTIC